MPPLKKTKMALFLGSTCLKTKLTWVLEIGESTKPISALTSTSVGRMLTCGNLLSEVGMYPNSECWMRRLATEFHPLKPLPNCVAPTCWVATTAPISVLRLLASNSTFRLRLMNSSDNPVLTKAFNQRDYEKV